MRRLIITADDLGVTSQRSHGIFQCAEQGTLTSALLVCNGSDSERAARHAKERDLSIGLLLNFTNGSPISKRAADIHSLLTTDGYFVGHETFLRLLAEKSVDPTHLEREIRAQIEWFLDARGQPTHIAAGGHLHVHPVIAPVLVPILERYGIAFVRIPTEPLPPFGFQIDKDELKAAQAIAQMAGVARPLFAAHGIGFTDHFRGLALCGNASQRNLRHVLSRLPEGTTELMVHPGSPTTTGDEFERDPQRQTELNMLMNPELTAELKERGIELGSFEDLF